MVRSIAARRASLGGVALLVAAVGAYSAARAEPSAGPPPTTPIKHVVVIFGENESFDHYFGTYPTATNPPGQPTFIAKPGTPAVKGSRACWSAIRTRDDPGRASTARCRVTCDHEPQLRARSRRPTTTA